MLQTAVFVDAGYVYAQGSALLSGQKRPRTSISLSVDRVLAQLARVAGDVCPGTRLLRIYWYDGVLRGGRLTSEQMEIAQSPSVKLRLGLVNSKGEQKGVDSLIVTDLIDLARNHAISDALIVSGDEDIRIGVQIAQTFGVRVHLLGIKPARGSQSPDLIHEADTHHEWTEDVVAEWLTWEASAAQELSVRSLPKAGAAQDFDICATEEVRSALAALDRNLLGRAVRYLDTHRQQIMPELDRPTLARLRIRLDRDLSDDERKRYRAMFAELLRAAYPPP